MPNHNYIEIIGHLTREPELKYSSGGKAYTRFTVAVNNRNKEASFFNCVCFGKTAEWIAEAKKGDLVLAIGSMESSKSQEGQTYWTLVGNRVINFSRFSGAKKAQSGQINDEWSSLGTEVVLDE